MAQDGEIIGPGTIRRRQVETQYLDPSKVEDIEDSESEHEDEKKRQQQARNINSAKGNMTE